MNKIFKYIVPAAAMLLGLSSCLNDLHVEPIDPSVQTEIEAYQLFNKCYASFALAGNGGADGDSDVDGIDGGTSGLYRQYWNSQELTTDEAICSWGDEGVPSYNYNTYDASHPMLRGYYYRLALSITFCNQYLKDFADYDATMSAEVRFLRAFQFYLMMDAFGNIPFATTITSEKPQQASQADMFKYIEGELLSIAGENKNDTTNILAKAEPHKKGQERYGRVDKAAAWLLLARLYINAKVYTGSERLEDAKKFAELVVKSNYNLNTTKYSKDGREWSAYQMLFMGDNDHTSAAEEAIFPIMQDGNRTTSWGVSLFVIASTFDGDMHENPYDDDLDPDMRSVNGVSGQAWGGNRARPDLVRLFFPMDDAPEGNAGYQTAIAANDDRALFNTNGRSLYIEDPNTFKQGYAVAKFTNFTTDGSATSDPTHPDMDIFMLRKAEAYLILAEAYARQNEMKLALENLNIIRKRANARELNKINSLDDILDEYGREFYFEGHRRTDLIRFGKFGGNSDYTWQWKGGEFLGRNFEEYRNVFAIPTSDLIANKNLKQNPGYK